MWSQSVNLFKNVSKFPPYEMLLNAFHWILCSMHLFLFSPNVTVIAGLWMGMTVFLLLYQPALKCIPSHRVLIWLGVSLCQIERERVERRKVLAYMPPPGFESPKGVPQVQLLAWGPLLHPHSVGHNPSAGFSSAMTDMLLVNQWDLPSLRVSTAQGPASPRWHGEIFAVSGYVP